MRQEDDRGGPQDTGKAQEPEGSAEKAGSKKDKYQKAQAKAERAGEKLGKAREKLDKAREKAAEWQAKIRELEKQKQEEENSQIVQAVRSLKLTPAELMAFLNDPKNSLAASGHNGPKPEAPEKEDTAHEEN